LGQTECVLAGEELGEAGEEVEQAAGRVARASDRCVRCELGTILQRLDGLHDRRRVLSRREGAVGVQRLEQAVQEAERHVERHSRRAGDGRSAVAAEQVGEARVEPRRAAAAGDDAAA